MMLMSTDTINNRTIVYHDKDTHFTDDGTEISFDSIRAYYKRIVSYYSSHIYEGKRLNVDLFLDGKEKVYNLAISTDHIEKYKIVNTLNDAIAEYRLKKYLDLYEETKKVVFQTKFDDYDLVIDGDGVEVVYKNKKAHKGSFHVEKIYHYQGYTTFVSEKKKVQISSALISDSSIFLAMAQNIVEVNYWSNPPIKIEKYLWGAFLAFGLNGIVEYSFQVSLLDNIGWIKTLSKLSAILLGIALLSAPVYLLADKFNQRKLRKEAEELK